MREQAGHGADWIKVYADYRIGTDGSAQPTFTADELKAMVEAAHVSGRPVAAHAASDEGMRMAIEAGVDSIEHGNAGTDATFSLMRERGVAYLPTLTAVESYEQYFNHYVPGQSRRPRRCAKPSAPSVPRCRPARPSAAAATWACSAMATTTASRPGWCAWACPPAQALRACTSVAARILRQEDRIGRIAPGLRADLAAFTGDPSVTIETCAGRYS